MKKILIVEDEHSLALLLKDFLIQSSFSVLIVNDGAMVETSIIDFQPDLIILDIMLPNIDGITLCRTINQKHPDIRVIFTTAKISEIDRLLGLEIGADDYICKPYSPREVVARVKAQCRRTEQNDHSVHIVCNDDTLCIDVNQKQVQFTFIEYKLLSNLIEKKGGILSRNQLMDLIYDDHRVVTDRTIDSHIKKIRQKLLSATPHDLILSIYGVGYRYNPKSTD
jgi:two-component system, OmpR family, response regulator BaeR